MSAGLKDPWEDKGGLEQIYIMLFYSTLFHPSILFQILSGFLLSLGPTAFANHLAGPKESAQKIITIQKNETVIPGMVCSQIF